jgi:hypothetical protein
MATNQKRRAAGRPPIYKPEFAEQARKLCELGATDADVAEFFGVADRTIYRWQAQHDEFCQALKAGKVAADDRVERSLYHKACGYSFDAVKIFMPAGAKKPVLVPYREHVPPDTTACIFWLKNRRPVLWREKVDGAKAESESPFLQLLDHFNEIRREKREAAERSRR